MGMCKMESGTTGWKWWLEAHFLEFEDMLEVDSFKKKIKIPSLLFNLSCFDFSTYVFFYDCCSKPWLSNNHYFFFHFLLGLISLIFVLFVWLSRGKANFFERRVGDYQKASVMSSLDGGKNYVFKIDEDF